MPWSGRPSAYDAGVKVSTRGDYASRALLSLALHENDGPTSVRDIAERTGLPQPYLEQILLALKGAGLVRSKRGVGGGYVLARPPAEITLAEVVSAVDGPIQAGDFGKPHTNGACDHEGQCVLLAIWGDVGDQMQRALGQMQAISPYRLGERRVETDHQTHAPVRRRPSQPEGRLLGVVSSKMPIDHARARSSAP